MTGMKILWGPKLWDFMVCSEDPWRLRWNVSVRATVVHIACVSHIAPSFRIINAHCPETSLIDNKSLTWGLTLMDFKVPEGLLCRALGKHEVRIPSDNGTTFFIYDEKAHELRPQIPPGMDLGKTPLLLSISDQGPVNLSALNFLQYSSNALLMACQFDVFHRGWNDLKLALKKVTSCRAWKTLLQLTVVANLPYGPFGSSQWFFKLKSRLEEYLATHTYESPSWERIQHLICQEQRRVEPRNNEEAEQLFMSLRKMPSFIEKGPLIKLMRWFSFFESIVFLEGQFWARKLILQEGSSSQDPHEDESADDEMAKQESKDPAKQLQELKKKKGTWKLSISVSSEQNLAIKDCILATGRATWKLHAASAREVTSPIQVMEHNVACAGSRYWALELEQHVKYSLWDPRCLEHLFPSWRMHDMALQWHIELFHKVLEARAMSLTAFNELPPSCYHHAVSGVPSVASGAYQMACEHWRVLLEAEAAQNAGADIGPLSVMH